jgi:hypothetical protein
VQTVSQPTAGSAGTPRSRGGRDQFDEERLTLKLPDLHELTGSDNLRVRIVVVELDEPTCDPVIPDRIADEAGRLERLPKLSTLLPPEIPGGLSGSRSSTTGPQSRAPWPMPVRPEPTRCQWPQPRQPGHV